MAMLENQQFNEIFIVRFVWCQVCKLVWREGPKKRLL